MEYILHRGSVIMASVNGNKKQTPVVVVTGASAGIGRATAIEFAKQGMSLCLIARDWNRLEQLQHEIITMGGRAEFFCADVSDANQIESIAEKVEQSLGPIQIWVNNAAVSVYSRAIEMTPEEYKRVTQVSYLGYVNGTLAALKRMISRNEGVILQVGSALAYQGIPLQSAMSAVKHAIRGFTESVVAELKHDQSKVRMTHLLLPPINTPSFTWSRSRLAQKPKPIGPIYPPEIAAKAIVQVAFQFSQSEVWLGYSTAFAVLLERLFPALRRRFFSKYGYEIQQISHSNLMSRPDNLWESVSGGFQSHGVFDQRSKSKAGTAFLGKSYKLYLGLGLMALSSVILKNKMGQESKAA